MSTDKDLENNWAMGQPEEEEFDTMTLTLDDDSEVECLVLTTLEVDSKTYIALLPVENADTDEDEGEVFLYQFVQNGEEDVELINIESDEEFERVSEAFDEYMDSLEFDEVFGEDE